MKHYEKLLAKGCFSREQLTEVVATTTHFSTYILLNKVEFDKVWNYEIKVSANGENINIAFVVDLSGSMSGTKLSTTKTAINSFIDVLEEDDMAAIMNLLIGSKADVEQMYRILCYSDMCESYSKPLFWILTETDDKKYYYCYDQDKVKEVTRYMENIAQLRILGEQEYYKYIKNDGLLGFIGNYISGLDELKEEIESTILEVKERSDSLKLNLSTNIKYSVK